MKVIRLLLGFTCVIALSATSRANLLTNGDFSAGNSGFTSGYLFEPNNVVNGSTGIYSVGTSAVPVNPFWTDPTTVVQNGAPSPTPVVGQNFFMANGSTVSSVPVWQETISLVNGASYSFSGYLATLFAQNPATLTVAADGTQTIVTATAPSATGVWSGFQNTFIWGGPTGPVPIIITDTNLQGNGNDFAMANLVLTQVVPEPASMVLLGLGVTTFGLLSLRSRRRPTA